MENDRLRIHVDAPYAEALGRASIVFASAEWMAVYCCEKMQANYVQKLAKKTAGNIADDLNRLAGKLAAGPERQRSV